MHSRHCINEWEHIRGYTYQNLKGEVFYLLVANVITVPGINLVAQPQTSDYHSSVPQGLYDPIEKISQWRWTLDIAYAKFS